MGNEKWETRKWEMEWLNVASFPGSPERDSREWPICTIGSRDTTGGQARVPGPRKRH